MNEFAFESLTFDRSGQMIARSPGTAQCFREDLGGSLALEMLRIPAGLFQMGSPRYLGYPDEHPIHPVSVPAFWLGRTLVTQAQWRSLDCKKCLFASRATYARWSRSAALMPRSFAAA